jgi:hypothetical protein
MALPFSSALELVTLLLLPVMEATRVAGKGKWLVSHQAISVATMAVK